MPCCTMYTIAHNFEIIEKLFFRSNFFKFSAPPLFCGRSATVTVGTDMGAVVAGADGGTTGDGHGDAVDRIAWIE